MNANPRTAIFKQKVTIEALKGQRVIHESAKEYGVSSSPGWQVKKETDRWG